MRRAPPRTYAGVWKAPWHVKAKHARDSRSNAAEERGHEAGTDGREGRGADRRYRIQVQALGARGRTCRNASSSAAGRRRMHWCCACWSWGARARGGARRAPPPPSGGCGLDVLKFAPLSRDKDLHRSLQRLAS